METRLILIRDLTWISTFVCKISNNCLATGISHQQQIFAFSSIMLSWLVGGRLCQGYISLLFMLRFLCFSESLDVFKSKWQGPHSK